MKILRIVLFIVGCIFICPFLFVLWISVITGILIGEYIEELNWMEIFGGVMLGAIANTLWLAAVCIPLTIRLLGK